MRLNEYLIRSGESEAEFARRAGVPRGTILSITMGKLARGPRVDTAKKITLATGGLVGVDDLLPSEPQTGAA